MIYLKLNIEEALDLFELAIDNNEKKLSYRLKGELIDHVNSLNKIDQSKQMDLASAWLKNQIVKIEELKKNDSE